MIPNWLLIDPLLRVLKDRQLFYILRARIAPLKELGFVLEYRYLEMLDFLHCISNFLKLSNFVNIHLHLLHSYHRIQLINFAIHRHKALNNPR